MSYSLFSMYFAKMKQLASILIIITTISLLSCTHDSTGKVKLSYEDSLKIISDLAFQNTLSKLQKVHEDFSGPVMDGDTLVTGGEKFKSYLMDDTTTVIINQVGKLESKLRHAQKDSTTDYGALLTRFRMLKAKRKYLTGTYNDEAHLLRFTSEITFDDKHEEDKDYYFNNDTLVYFRERRTYAQKEQDISTDDFYFLINGKVAYSYRDVGAAEVQRDKMDYMASMKRYHLNGNLTAYVAMEFEEFKQDYDILLASPLEPLIYPGEQHPQ